MGDDGYEVEDVLPENHSAITPPIRSLTTFSCPAGLQMRGKVTYRRIQITLPDQ